MNIIYRYSDYLPCFTFVICIVTFLLTSPINDFLSNVFFSLYSTRMLAIDNGYEC